MTLPCFAFYQGTIGIPELSSERSYTLAVALVSVSITSLLQLKYEDIRALEPTPMDNNIGHHESFTIVVPIIGALLW